MKKNKQYILFLLLFVTLNIREVGIAHSQILERNASDESSTEEQLVDVTDGQTVNTSVNRQEFFGIVGQRMISYLNNLRAAIERSVGILDSQKKQLITDIAKDLSQIQTQTLIIGKTQTPTELNSRVTTLREQWERTENKFKYFVSLLVSARVGNAIDRFNGVSQKVDILIDRLEKENIDIQRIGQKRELFVEALTNAKASYGLAQTEFEKIQTQTDGQQFFLSGNEHLKKADISLRDARAIFRELLQDIKKLVPQENQGSTSTTSPEQI